MSILYLNHGEDFWRGIRDGGRAYRRAQMYAFLAKHKDGGGLNSDEKRHMYEVCLRTARQLSRTKTHQRNP